MTKKVARITKREIFMVQSVAYPSDQITINSTDFSSAIQKDRTKKKFHKINNAPINDNQFLNFKNQQYL